MSRTSSPARVAAWLLLLAAAQVVLSATGDVLAAPPAPWRGDELLAWIDASGAITAAFALVRILALVLTWYLIALTALALVARGAGSHPLARVVDRLALPFARRLLRNVLGTGLALSVTVGAGPGLMSASTVGAEPVRSPVVGTRIAELVVADDETAPGPLAPPTTITMTAEPLAEPPPTTAGPTSTTTATTLPTASTTTTPPTPPPTTPPTTVAPTTDPPAGVPPPSPSPAVPNPAVPNPAGPTTPATPSPATWTIGPGDHLWRVAEQTLARHLGRSPQPSEVAPYWQRLIDHNRDRLAVPDNPDLVFPGQEFALPDLP